MNIRRLIEIQAYRGIRHRHRQLAGSAASARTTNARETRKGPRRGAVAAKKQVKGKKRLIWGAGALAPAFQFR